MRSLVLVAAILGSAFHAAAAPVPLARLAGSVRAPVLMEAAVGVSRDRVGEAVAKRLVRRQVRRTVPPRR